MPEIGVVAWLAIGLVLGVGAKFLHGGMDLSGCVTTILCGVAGAIIAGWITAELLNWADRGRGYDLFMAFCGGVTVLWVLDSLAPRRPY